MNDENKLFTNILVYGFLILVGVQTIRMINNVFIAHQKNQNLTYSKKVASNNKVSINSSYKSPSQNYRNPYKECSYSKANYESIPNSTMDIRYCINENTKKITSVYNSEIIEYRGTLDKVIKKGGDWLDKPELFEWKIENNKLILYTCYELNGSCNGRSRRSVMGHKR